MRIDFRTLKGAISTLVVLCVLFLGMGLDVSAKDHGRKWGRGHNRGRHLGWTRGRRVGHHRRDDGSTWRRLVRRDRRQRRLERRSFWDDGSYRQRRRYMESGYWRYR